LPIFIRFYNQLRKILKGLNSVNIMEDWIKVDGGMVVGRFGRIG
jgi:hypothetical protein